MLRFKGIKLLFLLCICFCKTEFINADLPSVLDHQTIADAKKPSQKRSKRLQKTRAKKSHRKHHRRKWKKTRARKPKKSSYKAKKIRKSRKAKKARLRARNKRLRSKKHSRKSKKHRKNLKKLKSKERLFAPFYPYKTVSKADAIKNIIQEACDHLETRYKSISRTHLETVVRQYLDAKEKQYIVCIGSQVRYKKLGDETCNVPIRAAAEAEFAEYALEDRQRLVDYALENPFYDKRQVIDLIKPLNAHRRRLKSDIISARTYKQLLRAMYAFTHIDRERIPRRIADALHHALTQNNLYANIAQATAEGLTGSPLLRDKIDAIEGFCKIVNNLSFFSMAIDIAREPYTHDVNQRDIERNIRVVIEKFAHAAKKIIENTIGQSVTNVTSGSQSYPIGFNEINPRNDDFNNALNRYISISQPGNTAYDRLSQIAQSAEDGSDIEVINTGHVDITDVSKEKIVAYARELKEFLESSNATFDNKVQELLTISSTLRATPPTNAELKTTLIRSIDDANDERGIYSRQSVHRGGIHINSSGNIRTNLSNSIANMRNRHLNWQVDAVDVIARLKQELQLNHASNNKTQVALQVLDAFAGNVRDGERTQQYQNTALNEIIALIWNEIKRLPDEQEQSHFMETLIDRLFEIRFAHCGIPINVINTSGYQVEYMDGIIRNNMGWSCLDGVKERLIGMFDFSTFHDDIFVHDRSDTLSSRAIDWGDFNYQVGQNIDKHIMKLFELMSVNTPTSFVSLDHNEALYRRIAFWRMAKWYNALTAATNGQIEAMNDLRLRTIVFAEGTQTVIGDQIF